MSNEANAPHLEDIARVLGDEVDRELIARELDEYLNVYRVPLGTAKDSIVKTAAWDIWPRNRACSAS